MAGAFMSHRRHSRDLLVNLWIDCCFIDGADVLYNKFNVESSSPPDNPPARPNSDYNCVVATTGLWRVSGCDEQHHVVCQSDHDTLSSGIVSDNILTQSHLFTYLLLLFLPPPPLPSARQHLSYGDCLEVKREYYQNSSVPDCVTMFTVCSTLM